MSTPGKSSILDKFRPISFITIHSLQDPLGMRANPGIHIREAYTAGLHPRRNANNVIAHNQTSTRIAHADALAQLRERANCAIVDKLMPLRMTGPTSLVGYNLRLQRLKIIRQLQVSVLQLEIRWQIPWRFDQIRNSHWSGPSPRRRRTIPKCTRFRPGSVGRPH